MKRFKEIREKYVSRSKGEQDFVDAHDVEVLDHEGDEDLPLKDAKARKQAKRKNDKETIADVDAVKEEVEPLQEKNVMATLQDIVNKKSAMSVKFDDGKTLKVDMTTANAIVNVHSKLNDANKKKVAAMIEKDKMSFMKMVDFAFSR
jgi:hypothetical protein